MKLFRFVLIALLVCLTGCAPFRVATRSEVEKLMEVEKEESRKPDDLR